MVVRSDVDISWYLDPRIVYVRAPSTEIDAQDLHDTLREIEQRPANLIYPFIISSAGKEDLGGGTFVGITSTLQNAKIAFEARRTFVSDGYITTPDGTGRLLLDFNATFITDGVQPGGWIVNRTDGSICSVVTVDSETQISTDFLGGGDTNAFNLNDQYKIMNVTQCEIAGGNVVAVDGYGNVIDPVLPTAGTQVVRTSASSATLQSQLQLEHSTFNGAVTVDIINGTGGTTFPTGTQRQPSNNIVDAVSIANERGFSILRIQGNITLDTGDDVSGLTLIGENPGRTTITVNSGANTSDIQMNDVTVTGEFDTSAEFFDCHLVNIQFVEADIHRCILEGTITLSGSGQTRLIDCQDGLIADAPPPSIDFNGSGRSLSIRNYHGDIELKNKTGSENVEININSGGRVVIASTITGGTFRLSGIIEVDDNSTGAAVIDISEVIFPDQVQLSSFNGHIRIDVDNGFAETKFPAGTHQRPVNNLSDALTISAIRGINTFLVDGYLAVSASDNIDGYLFLGNNELSSTVTVASGASTTQTRFENIILAGTVNGAITCTNVNLQTLAGVGSDTSATVFDRCILTEGIHTLRNGLSTPQNIHFIECASGVPGDGYAQLNFNNTTSPVAFRDFRGGLNITNYTGGQNSTFSFSGGQFVVESSCNSGTAQVDGLVEITDASTGSFTIVERSNLNKVAVANAVWDELLEDHIDASTFGGWVGGKLITVAKFLALK